MKRTILALIIVVMVSTPCLAEVEPGNISSVERTLWDQCEIVFTSYKPFFSMNCDKELGFYQGKVYNCKDDGCEVISSYADLGAVSIARDINRGTNYYLAIMQPTIGFGAFTWGHIDCSCWWFACGCALVYEIGIMTKNDDNWMPPFDILAVWGTSGTDVFAVGKSGTILHYDGSTWSPMANVTTNWLNAVWGSSGSDVFTVGFAFDEPKSAVILHYNGSTWSPMASGTTNWLSAVWGSSGTDVFAVGNYSTILHYDGNTWSSMGLGTDSSLSAVWGSSGTDVFALCGDGTIRHYDGSAWSSMASGTTNLLYAVWGSSGTDVFAVGEYGTILHYDGSTWSSMGNDK